MNEDVLEEIPEESAAPVPIDQFLGLDSTRVTLREYYWGANVLGVIVGGIAKLLRAPIVSSTDDPNVRSLAPFETAEADVPEPTRHRLAPTIAQLEKLGFHSPLYHVIRDELLRTTTNLVTLVHSSGQAIARGHNRVWGIRVPPKDIVFVEFLTPFSNGHFLWSLSSKPDMLEPPNCIAIRKQGATPEALWQAHQDRLNQVRSNRTIVPVSVESMRNVVEQHHASVVDFHLKRGVFRPLTESEKTRFLALTENRSDMSTGIQANADVLVELDKLQNKKTSWRNSLIVLVGSVILFAAVGRSRFDWEDLLILIGILFFHETGHFLAMKIFRYRNVRMFFIPLFGAAVSGQNFSAPGWKKVIVSLMGPLPGILVGIGIGLAGLAMDHPMLVKIGQMTIIINGFNLLPVLPLDGGQIMHALLFSRHYLLDAGFRLLAAVALIGISFALHDQLLRYLGIFMLIGLIASFRIAKVTAELRKSGLKPEMADGQTIPVPVASVIVDKLRGGIGRQQSAKVLAQQTLQVFENLAARPPGIGASFALGTVHAFSFAAALLFAAILLVGPNMDVFRHAIARNTLARNPFMPQALKHPVSLADMQSWRVGDTEPGIVIAGTLAKADEARSLYAQVQMIEGSQARLFGHTVLLAFDKRPAEWLDYVKLMESTGAEVFVDQSGWHNSFRIQCTAASADDARLIADEFTGYGTGSAHMHLIPPWTLADSPPATRERFARARETYRTLIHSSAGVYEQPELQALSVKMAEAQRLDDQEALDRLQKQQKALLPALHRKHLQALIDNPAPQTDLEVVRVHMTYDAFANPSAKYPYASMAPLLGELPMRDGKPVPGEERTSVSGALVANDATLTGYLTCRDLLHGPPAVIQWLISRGCRDFRYELGQGHHFEGAEDLVD